MNSNNRLLLFEDAIFQTCSLSLYIYLYNIYIHVNNGYVSEAVSSDYHHNHGARIYDAEC